MPLVRSDHDQVSACFRGHVDQASFHVTHCWQDAHSQAIVWEVFRGATLQVSPQRFFHINLERRLTPAGLQAPGPFAGIIVYKADREFAWPDFEQLPRVCHCGL